MVRASALRQGPDVLQDHGQHSCQEMIAAFEPMTEMEVARRQIIELRQTSHVSGYI